MITKEIHKARILAVDDEPANLALLEGLLGQWGFHNLEQIRDPRLVSQAVVNNPPDLILIDLHMPHMDGFQLLAELQVLIPAEDLVPILVLTADITARARETALKLGARDFLTKPFDHTEVMLRVTNHLETRRLHVKLARHKNQLEQLVQARTADLMKRTEELNEARIETLRRLAKAAEYRDDNTGRHTIRVGLIAATLAEAYGCDPEFITRLREAAPLHDIGKIGIPDSILLKPGKLTPEEWDVMKSHTRLGAEILRGSTGDVLNLAEEIAVTHHEKWDGRGYDGLAGEDIPLSGRIVAVADVFDALTHERPYKRAWTREEAIAEIVAQSGKHFDPAAVVAFQRVANILPIDKAPASAAPPQ